MVDLQMSAMRTEWKFNERISKGVGTARVFKLQRHQTEDAFMANSLAHATWICNYHIAFARKMLKRRHINSRKFIWMERAEAIVGDMMPITSTYWCQYHPNEHIDACGIPDPKGESAMMIFEHYANLLYNAAWIYRSIASEPFFSLQWVDRSLFLFPRAYLFAARFCTAGKALLQQFYRCTSFGCLYPYILLFYF